MANPKSYKYQVVDVFTRVPLEGNALAVFPDSRGLDDGTMLRIARELNLSETVFFEEPTHPGCVKSLRIFTPAREIVFAGHPTVGSCYVLLKEGMVAQGARHFTIQEKIGPIPIRVEPGDPPLIWLETPPISFRETFDAAVCAKALGLETEDLLNVPPQFVTAGNPTLLVALKEQSAVDRVSLDLNLLARLQSGYPEPFCFFVFAPARTGAYSRMFAPQYGVMEDPATGSSTGPLAAYMKHHGLLPNSADGRYISEQGTKMGRRSLLHFEVLTCAGAPDRISVGGHVIPLVEAVMTL